jgi:hypothetical protein
MLAAFPELACRILVSQIAVEVSAFFLSFFLLVRPHFVLRLCPLVRHLASPHGATIARLMERGKGIEPA